MRSLVFAAALCTSSCASLRTGWARVTWLDGGVVPVSICTAQIGAEGDVEMYCTQSTAAESSEFWRREKRRTGGGT